MSKTDIEPMTEGKRTELIQRIEKALDDVRPHLQEDGGNVEVVELTDDYKLMVKWIGACESCIMSEMTLRAGIQETIQIRVPEVAIVEAIN